MQIFKHAYYTLKQNKVFGLILFLYLSLYLGLLFGLSDSISSFKREIENSQRKYKEQLTIVPDAIEASGVEQNIPLAELKQYGDSRYLSHAYYSGLIHFEQTLPTQESNGREKVAENDSQQTIIQQNSAESQSQEQASRQTSIYSVALIAESLNLLATNLGETLIEGTYNLVSGECLVGEAYAQKQGVSVGDIVTLDNGTASIDLRVKGIYEEPQLAADWTSIYTTTETLEQASFGQEVYWSPTYYLADGFQLSDFAKEVTQKGLSKDFQVYSTKDFSTEETHWVEEALAQAKNSRILVLLVGGLGLFGLTALHRKSQHTTIGYLYAAGSSKGRLMFLHISISLLIILLAGLSASVAASWVANDLAQWMLSQTMAGAFFQTVSVLTTGLSIANPGLGEPITAVHVNTGFSVQKACWLVISFLLLIMFKGYLIRHFQLVQPNEEGLE